MSEHVIETPGFRLSKNSGERLEKVSVAADRVNDESAFATALSLEGISLSFGGVTAIEDIDLIVREGEIRSIIGPNGAGKSSLINVISGIYQPNHGKIRLAGKSFKRVPTHRLARLGVARTYQNLALFKDLTVLDNIRIARVSQNRASWIEQLVGLGRARSENRESLEKAREMIEFLDLREIVDRKTGTLSYGLQKRVELARALVAQPKVLLLDEPMAGMTISDKVDMTRFIRAARDEFGTTVILIEHDLGVVMEISDHIAVLDHGRKIADGTPSEVRKNQTVIDAYMGVVREEKSQPEAAA